MSFDVLNTHTSVSAAVFGVDLSANTLGNAGEFTFTVDGQPVEATSNFATTFIYPGTTLELSFSSRQTAFHFTGEGSTEVTIPPPVHSHLTVDGIETAVYIPGFTTTIVLTGSSDIIVDVPATTTQMTIPEATYVFSAITDIVATFENGETYYCGTNTETTFEAAADKSPCVMGTTFTVTLPSSAITYHLDHGKFKSHFIITKATITIIGGMDPYVTSERKRNGPLVQ